MNKRITFLLCAIFICNTLTFGQGLQHTWNLSETMTATLDIEKSEFTIKTTKVGEEMPGYFYSDTQPWLSVASAITSIIIENGVGSIGTNVFLGFDNLTSINIPNSVTMIGDGAFSKCIKLASISIPNSVTTIGNHAFYGCKSLTSINFPNSVTTIGMNAFAECNSLTFVDIPPSIKTIGINTFIKCSNLASVNIACQTVGGGAFYDCPNLTTVTISSSVTTLEGNVFNACFNLKDVTVSWIIPLNIPSTNFSVVNNTGVTLHVPAGTENLYKVAPVWKDFKISTYTVDNENINTQSLNAYSTKGMMQINGLLTGQSLYIYSINGQLVYQGIANAEQEQIPVATSGVYVVVAGEQKVKVIVN